MGALHDGHAALARAAREYVGEVGSVVATVFVNPTQFEDPADLADYPRTLAADAALLEANGVDLLLAPSVAEVYPAGGQVTVDPGPLGLVLEGASRPGHFTGVLTVVAKLLNITATDVALFGQKDYQQLTVIRRMVRDLEMPVRIVGVPTVRDADGVALSSRNSRLSQQGRRQAASVPEALRQVSTALRSGQTIQQAVDAGHVHLHDNGVTDVDYLVVTGPDLGPVPASGTARVLTAVTIEGVRLIDNMEVEI
jgi:pantoate--beta-alanine ligase